MSKKFLSQKGLIFTETDITKNPSAEEELEKLGVMTMPVILVNGERVSGFNQKKLEELLS